MLFKALQYLIAGVVDEPKNVAVDRIETVKVDIYYLSSPKGELGRLLGRQGRTVEAMRDVLSAIARKLEKEAIIDVIEQRLEATPSAEERRDRRQRPPREARHRDRAPQRFQRGSQRPQNAPPRPRQGGGRDNRGSRPRNKNGRGNTPPQGPSTS